MKMLSSFTVLPSLNKCISSDEKLPTLTAIAFFFFLILLKSMENRNCFVTHFLQNLFSYVQQKKESQSHTYLKQLEGE